eukprot:COSAG01_NODE_35230_length_535_cov_0.465596_1_plen_137_part_10
MMARATSNTTYIQEALRPIAYTLPSIAAYASDFSYRGVVPTFMQMSAMRSSYATAFEGHNTLQHFDRSIRFSETSLASPSMKLPAHVVEILRTTLKYSLGQMRFAYPDRLPAFLFSPIARPAGPPGTVNGSDPFNFS